MITKPQRSLRLADALRDHSLEGIAILVSEPARLIKVTNILIAGVLLVAFIWAFFAKADVVVTAQGVLVPKADIRRVYAPIDGELVDVYVSPGVPVQEGDIIARINARSAIDSASKALESKLRLDQAQLEYERLPAKLALQQRKAEAMKAKLDFLQQETDKKLEEGLFKLAGAQRAKLDEARAALEQARRTEAAAEEEKAQYERLASMEGGGGVSQMQVQQKFNAYLDAQAKTGAAQARLSSLEYELNRAISEADSNVANASQELAEQRVQYETLLRDMEQEQAKVEFQLRSARIAADAAERVSFKNFDENNFLKIHAPISGVVTEVPLTQRGDKVQSSQPLVNIAPSDTQRILQIQIPENERGFLQVGQSVKVKFNAFPYQTYGSVEGRLDYISPAVVQGKEGAPPTYEGKVQLERETIETTNGDVLLRYGMGGVAEIVVRKRRVIDLALEPFRSAR
ncbi:HlyD family efflux transporter periplasmic adaptor subunit [Haliea salexigens]|uniref:HlyD family efflux transporter periplasmic adaptor subunit n=1 Tax=Haliea salexigens TaxID=287487 RepID=UPI0003FAC5CC|nr:HlyD family efflux transporter periplasmic adaptor subunit [Haliea salexigens]